MNKLDHIVIAASSLKQGIEYVHDKLGVILPKGGVHKTMGTHNHVMSLNSSQHSQSYLEVIAINPEALPPTQPRWFALDDPLMRQAIAKKPRLITWVMNTLDINQLKSKANFDIGLPTPLRRDQLSWDFAIPDDGRLLASGLLPYCIQWHGLHHPSMNMANLECQLIKVELYHNRADWIKTRLESIAAVDLVEIHSIADDVAPHLRATIQTRNGYVLF